MRRFFLSGVLGLATVCFLDTGCNRNSLEQSFRNAPPPTRQSLAEAIALDKAADYLGAAEKYDALLRLSLTPEQESSVQSAVGELYHRMCKAAEVGDSKAKKTLDFINDRNRNRGK
jgi:hypothetical protein